ncbi:hypothetical protein VPH35_072758 [Triticum aestivum]
MASAAPRHKGDGEAGERRRKKGGVVRRPSEELAGAGRRRTGAGDGGVRRGGAKSLQVEAGVEAEDERIPGLILACTQLPRSIPSYPSGPSSMARMRRTPTRGKKGDHARWSTPAPS